MGLDLKIIIDVTHIRCDVNVLQFNRDYELFECFKDLGTPVEDHVYVRDKYTKVNPYGEPILVTNPSALIERFNRYDYDLTHFNAVIKATIESLAEEVGDNVKIFIVWG